MMQKSEPEKLNLLKILNSKGEYPTHSFCKDYNKNFVYYVPLVELIRDEAIRKRKFSAEAIYACIIQSTYMAFVSSFYRINLQPGQLVVDHRESALTSNVNQPINFELAYSFEAVLNSKMDFINFVQGQVDGILEIARNIPSLANDPGVRVFASQFQRIRSMPWNREKQKQFMLCLQETELFRKHSLLLKIKNCSVVNLIKKEQRSTRMNEIKRLEREYMDIHNNHCKSGQTPAEILRESERQIEQNTKDFFTEFKGWECTICDGNNTEDTYHLKFELRYSEKAYNFEKEVQAITQTAVQPGEKGQYKPSSMEFLVEYSAERNSICVKLITNIAVQVDSSDFLMFQCNNLSFDSCNVNLEFIDKPTPNPQLQKMRQIAFKTTSCFTRKEPPIEKILLLIDIVVITSKILEPELLKSTVSTKDYNKAKELHRKVSHFISILNFVSKKVNSLREQSSKNRHT